LASLRFPVQAPFLSLHLNRNPSLSHNPAL
jgi:hypothetical protein